MKRFILGIILFQYSIWSWSQDAYICIPTAKTGFIFNSNSKKWEVTRFTVADQKKILSRNGNSWEWKQFGLPYSLSIICGGSKSDPKGDDFNASGFLYCEGFATYLRISKNSLRYIEIFDYGFVDGKDLDSFTPSMEMGTCVVLK